MTKKIFAPLISVIIPVFNAENYLSRTFESLKFQSYENLEFLFIDDGSSDNSKDMIRDFINKDKRGRLLSKENGGPASARNLGIKSANGDFVAFIDADDSIDMNYIKILYSNIEAANICVCKYEKNNINGSFVPNWPNQKLELSGRRAASKIYENDSHVMCISPWCKLFRYEFIKKYKFPEGIMAEDEALAYIIFYEANRVVFLPNVLYKYYSNVNSDSNRFIAIKAIDMCSIFFRQYTYFQKRDSVLAKIAYFNYFDNFYAYLYLLKKSNLEVHNELFEKNSANKYSFFKYFLRAPIKSVMTLLRIIRYRFAPSKK